MRIMTRCNKHRVIRKTFTGNIIQLVDLLMELVSNEVPEVGAGRGSLRGTHGTVLFDLDVFERHLDVAVS